MDEDLKIPQDYVSDFNLGYEFGRSFPELCDSIDLSAKNPAETGIIAGMQEANLEYRKELDELARLRQGDDIEKADDRAR